MTWREQFYRDNPPKDAIALIPLTKGKVAIIDAEDFDRVSRLKWCCPGAYPTRSVRSASTKGGFSTQRLHHFILGLPPSQQVDHRNHNTLDTRKCNLRPCNSMQNNQNSRKRRGSSRYKGVSWCKRDEVWRAHISVNKKHLALGSYRSEEDAARAYNTAAKAYFCEFAVINPVEPLFPLTSLPTRPKGA